MEMKQRIMFETEIMELLVAKVGNIEIHTKSDVIQFF